MKEIEKLASVHLGKAGDGSVVKPYVTPDTIDPNLIVAVPRHLNRTEYGIDENTRMVGYDVWHAYEFSTLTGNGFPVTGMLKWVYDSNTYNIIESKSAKLFLNSFNMHRWPSNSQSALEELYSAIGTDSVRDKNLGLVGSVATSAQFEFHEHFKNKVLTETEAEKSAHLLDEYLHLDMEDEGLAPADPFNIPFTRITDVVDLSSIVFEHFNEDPAILKVVDSTEEYVAWTTDVLRSNCRVTNQPDWGDVYVYIKGKKTVTPESLLQYVVSMRKENHFHEEIAECIYKRLLDLLEPDELLVSCLYTRRGGIDICPVRATSQDVINAIASELVSVTSITKKTLKQ